MSSKWTLKEVGKVDCFSLINLYRNGSLIIPHVDRTRAYDYVLEFGSVKDVLREESIYPRFVVESTVANLLKCTEELYGSVVRAALARRDSSFQPPPFHHPRQSKKGRRQ